MNDAANMFKKLAEGRLKSTPPSAKTKEESKPAPKSNPPEKAKKTTPEPSPEEKPLAEAIAFEELNKPEFGIRKGTGSKLKITTNSVNLPYV